MEGSGSSGFDMSKMSTAEKLLAGGSILLLIDSFLPWQKFCVDLGGLEDLVGSDGCVATANMWEGSGGILGVLAGLLAIALIVVGVLSMTGAMGNMNMGSMSADKLVAWLGAGVFVFGIIKFLIVLFNEVAWAAFVGLILLAAIGWGAWQKLQSSGGLTMGGTTGGGTMGGGMPPSSPPPSAPPSAPPTAPPPTTPPPSTPPPSDPSGF
jgi:hypothetical protein